MITGFDVTDAVEQILVAHMPAVLATLPDLPVGPARLVPVVHWEQIPTREALQASKSLPAGSITSPGLADEPERDGSGGYDAVWVVGVGLYARGESHRDTSQRVRMYAAAARSCLLHHPDLGGLASGLRWTGEEYALLDPRAARTIGGALVEFEVTVPDVDDETDDVSVPVTTTSLTADLLPVFGEDPL